MPDRIIRPSSSRPREGGGHPLSKQQKWNRKNPRKMAEATARWRQKNPEKALKDNLEYRRKNPLRMLFVRIKRKAKRLGLEFDLEFDQLIVPKRCPVLGIPIGFKPRGNGMCPDVPSIDRIDNTKGYTKVNTVIVSWRANQIKRDATIDELIRISRFYERFK